MNRYRITLTLALVYNNGQRKWPSTLRLHVRGKYICTWKNSLDFPGSETLMLARVLNVNRTRVRTVFSVQVVTFPPTPHRIFMAHEIHQTSSTVCRTAGKRIGYWYAKQSSHITPRKEASGEGWTNINTDKLWVFFAYLFTLSGFPLPQH